MFHRNWLVDSTPSDLWDSWRSPDATPESLQHLLWLTYNRFSCICERQNYRGSLKNHFKSKKNLFGGCYAWAPMAGSGSDHRLQWQPAKGWENVEGFHPLALPLKDSFTDFWSSNRELGNLWNWWKKKNKETTATKIIELKGERWWTWQWTPRLKWLKSTFLRKISDFFPNGVLGHRTPKTMLSAMMFFSSISDLGNSRCAGDRIPLVESMSTKGLGGQPAGSSVCSRVMG